MGVRILHDRESDVAALYCSTSDVAFGPLFYGTREREGDERAEAFVKWLPQDARRYTDRELMQQFVMWQGQEEDYWRSQDAPKCDDCGKPVAANTALCAACLERATS